MPDSCYLCGATSDLTLDHVPPENLFPPPKPSDLIKVVCCGTCNNSYSKDDEVFRLWVSSSMIRSAAGDWIWHNKVLGSTLPRSPKLHKNLKPFVGSIKLTTDDGIVEIPTLGIPQQRAIRYLTRITKGLLRHFYPDYDYSSDIFRAFQVSSTERGVKQVQDIVPFLTRDERGKGVFRFWRGFATDIENSAIWVYIFYEGACFIVFNRHKELPFPNEA